MQQNFQNEIERFKLFFWMTSDRGNKIKKLDKEIKFNAKIIKKDLLRIFQGE